MKALVSPLNWGMGHATRMVPVIEQLLALDVEVLLAANGSGREFLQQRFPQLQVLTDSPDLEVTYRKNLKLGLMLDSPKFLKLIKAENEWLKEKVDREQLDLVVSDNRYGLYHDSVTSIIVTHQLSIEAGAFSKAANLVNHRLLKKFDECWVPDDPKLQLAGQLSSGESNMPFHYIGPLTRLDGLGSAVQEGRILCLVSGPEPARTEFEEILVELMSAYDDWILLQGKPGVYLSEGNIKSHMSDDALAHEIEKADLLIARAGYSTLMDLHSAGKKLLLVPTPGQTEQEYLAMHWESNGWAMNVPQHELISDVIKRALAQGNMVSLVSEKLLPEVASRVIGQVADSKSISP